MYVCGSALSGFNLMINAVATPAPDPCCFLCICPRLRKKGVVSCGRGLPGSFLSLYRQECEWLSKRSPGSQSPPLRVPSPDRAPFPSPVDTAGCPFMEGHWQKHLNTPGRGRLLCAGLRVSCPVREEGGVMRR